MFNDFLASDLGRRTTSSSRHPSKPASPATGICFVHGAPVSVPAAKCMIACLHRRSSCAFMGTGERGSPGSKRAARWISHSRLGSWHASFYRLQREFY
ncbi:Zinc Finger Protein 40 [Manis pentadactyla]|nr:Zinc Finger Protein 40 [Manis pentadactyla]